MDWAHGLLSLGFDHAADEKQVPHLLSRIPSDRASACISDLSPNTLNTGLPKHKNHVASFASPRENDIAEIVLRHRVLHQGDHRGFGTPADRACPIFTASMEFRRLRIHAAVFRWALEDRESSLYRRLIAMGETGPQDPGACNSAPTPTVPSAKPSAKTSPSPPASLLRFPPQTQLRPTPVP